jgi:sulfonate transport system permease protein
MVVVQPKVELAADRRSTPEPVVIRLVPDLERPQFLGTLPRPRSLSIVVRASVPVLLLATWWFLTSAEKVSPTVLASPGAVARALLELYQTGELRQFLVASFARVGAGVGVGVSVGLVLDISSGLSALGEDIVDPTMQMLRAVPFLALAPLLISWFGIDETFKVVLIACASTFPMYAYSYLGVRNVDRKMVEAARSFGLRRWRLLVQVILPSTLPSILMALRICLAISVVGLIAAEQVGTTRGIGYLVLLAKQYFRQDYMVLCILLYASLGLLFDGLIRFLERICMPWRRHSTIR